MDHSGCSPQTSWVNLARALISSGLSSGFIDSHALDDDALFRCSVTRAIGTGGDTSLGHVLHDGQATRDSPKRCVVAGQCRGPVHEEELAPVTARLLGMRHGDRARWIGCRRRRAVVRDLVGETITGPATSLAGRIAALEHIDAAGGEPVAFGVAEVVFSGQVDKRIHRTGGFARREVNADVPTVSFDGRLVGGLDIRRGRRATDLSGRRWCGRVTAVGHRSGRLHSLPPAWCRRGALGCRGGGRPTGWREDEIADHRKHDDSDPRRTDRGPLPHAPGPLGAALCPALVPLAGQLALAILLTHRAAPPCPGCTVCAADAVLVA